MKRSFLLVGMLCLLVPFVFWGCSGDDGATGATGATGDTGATGAPGPGVLAKENCNTCHGKGKSEDVAAVHQISASNGALLTSGTVTAEPSAMTFTPAGDDDNVTVTVTFKFTAKNSAGTTVTSAIDLRSAGDGSAPQYLRFSLARLVPGVPTFGAEVGSVPAGGAGHTPNEWNAYIVSTGTGSSPYYTTSGTISGNPSTGTYTYTFPAGKVRGYVPGVNDNQVHRVAIQVRQPPLSAFFVNGLDPSLEAPVGNNTFDWVPLLAAVPTTAYPTRNVVTTAACNQCHDPLAIHGGGRRITPFCVVCHNPTILTTAGGSYDNGTLVEMAHGIHSEKNIGELGDFTEITYPQNMKNCDTCHQGGSDSANWKNLPSILGCGSCHGYSIFATGGNHAGKVDKSCDLCHSPTGVGLIPPSTTAAHADNTATPTNVPAGLDNIAYNINTVTLDDDYPVVMFRVLKNNVPIVFNKYTGPLDNVTRVKAFVDNGLINGYTGSPTFIVTWAADQDGVNPVADYNNLGVVQLFGTTVKGQGQPVTVGVSEIFLNDNTAGIIQSGPDGSGYYTVKLLQQVSRSSTTGVITNRYSAQNPLDSYMRAVALQGRVSQLVGGVAVRRPATSVVKEVTGDTVRRVAVSKDACLGCHKQLALHGSNRVNEVQVCVMCHNPNLGQKISSTATSVSWNMKDMAHGIHAASSTYGEFEEVTYPAQLKHCTKCHIDDTYKTELPDGVLLSTDTSIGAAPGLQDNVNSPLAAACGRCHNPNTELQSPSTVYDHYKLMGGDVGGTREVADLVAPPYPLAPVFMGP